MKLYFVITVGLLALAGCRAENSSEADEVAQSDPAINSDESNSSEEKPIKIAEPILLPMLPANNPWVALWNHWGTTGGAGPNNEPGFWVHIPKPLTDFRFQPVKNN